MRRLFTVTALAIIFATGGTLTAGTYTIDPVHSTVAFKIRHLVSRTGGEFTDFGGTIVADFENLDACMISLHINADSIDTGDTDRDEHLRSDEFFGVREHPEITFNSSKITRVDKQNFAVVGTLTMHGVSRQITLTVTYLGEVADPWGGVRAGYQLTTTVNRKNFGISWNKTLDNGGLILGDEVEISIDLEVVMRQQTTESW